MSHMSATVQVRCQALESLEATFQEANCADAAAPIIERIVAAFEETMGAPFPRQLVYWCMIMNCFCDAEEDKGFTQILVIDDHATAGDAHVRVATASLAAVKAAFAGTCATLLQPHLDRIIGPLLLRAADGKEALRGPAAKALAAFQMGYSADTFVGTLAGALGAMRSTKAQAVALQAFCAAASQQRLHAGDLNPSTIRCDASPRWFAVPACTNAHGTACVVPV